MNLEISQELDLEVREKSLVIDTLSMILKEYLSNREYGQDVQNIYIGCICIKPRVGYEGWFKIRKPKYKEFLRIELSSIEIIELKGVFTYDIKLDFDVFVNNTDVENKKLLALEILNSFSNLDALPKKVKHFDKERFISDVEQFFKAKKLI